MRNSSKLIVAATVLALLLAGCFGTQLKPTPTPTPRPPETKLEGRVTAPPGTPGTEAVSAASVAQRGGPLLFAMEDEAPVAGADVVALTVPEMTALPQTVKTDEDGKYTLTGLPEDRPVIVVATKTEGERSIRLSTYVPSVAKDRTTTAEVDVVTSLATEALASKIAENSDYAVTEDVWTEARERAEAYVGEASGDEERLASLVVVGEGVLEPGNVGSVDEEFEKEMDLPDDPGADGEEPSPFDEALQDAKAMVQALRDAGYGVKDSLEARVDDHVDRLNEEVVPVTEEMVQVMARTLGVLRIVQEFEEGGVFQWQQGRGFKKSASGPEGSWTVHVYELNEDNVPVPVEETYYIAATDGQDDTYRLTAEAMNHDLIFRYFLVPEMPADPGLDMVLHGQMELPSRAVIYFDDVSASGRSYMIEGAGKTTAQRGEFELEGLIHSDVFAIDGSVRFDMTTFCRDVEDEFGFYNFCVETYDHVTADGTFTTDGLTVNGYVEFEMEGFDAEEADRILMPHDPEELDAIEFHVQKMVLGGFIRENEDDGLGFTGELTVENVVVDDAGGTSLQDATARLAGEVRIPKQKPVEVDMTMRWSDVDGLASEFTYEQGEHVIEGTFRVSEGPKSEARLEAANQKNVRIEVDYDPSADEAKGRIWKDSLEQDLAEIVVSLEGWIEVRFADGEVESFL